MLKLLLHTSAAAWFLGAASGCTSRDTEKAPPDAGVPGDPACALMATYGCPAAGRPITAKNDALRTGWYPNQPALHPAIVGGDGFGRLFKTELPLQPGEMVLAQPLVFGTTVFVVTEANNVYALDGETGGVTASRSLGPSWNASDVGCADLPLVGITGTPTIDPTTGTAYFLSKTYKSNASAAVWYAHAVDARTLAERPGFPVEIAGHAANDPSIVFNPTYQMQRPGLLLMGDVVYAAFGPHCDIGPYHGYVVGIGTDGRITTIFATEAGPGAVRGAGIWQSGGGIVSDGPGRLFVSTGNAYSNPLTAPIPGSRPPATLQESVARLEVQSDGSLRAVDFFAPYDAAELDAADLEIGSGGPIALPDSFGSADHPHLVLTGGKEGHLYVLDRDELGGFKQGPNGGDANVSEVAAKGGLWSAPALWPGDGGWVYVTPKHAPVQAFRSAPRADGVPTLASAGLTSDLYGYFSGSPIVTSDGLTSASALLWVTYTSSAWADGSLRAYLAVPDGSGTLVQVFEDPYGKSAKFQVPGVGAGRIYIGTSDGHVVGYGAHATSSISGDPLDFGVLVLHRSSTRTLVLVANESTQVTGLVSENPAFMLGTPSPALPLDMAAGDTLAVPVTFTAAEAQLYVGAVVIATKAGPTAVSLKGRGQTDVGKLRVSPTAVRFGGIAVGTSKTTNLVLTNVGSMDLVFSGGQPPAWPFAVLGAPAVGQVLPGGASVTATVAFSPDVTGTFSSTMMLRGNSIEVPIYLSGTSAEPAVLVVQPNTLDFGELAPGSTKTLSFFVTNAGGVDLLITKSKPPILGAFTATTSLPEGAVVGAGNSVVETVAFEPRVAGAFEDSWVIGSSAATGSRTVTLRGTAKPAEPNDGGTD
jgi:hypothetical protein